MSVARGEGEIESATRRVWSQIDEAADRLAAEVARLRIDARIARPRFQVSSAQLDPRRSGSAKTLRESLRQLVGESQLAELGVRAIEHVLRYSMPVVPRRAERSAVGDVGRKSEGVIDIHGDVDEIASV